MENERFVDVEGRKVPMSEFMKEEVWRTADGISNDWSVLEVSNYGRMRYRNNRTNKSNLITTGKATVVSEGGKVRVLIPVIMTNVFMGYTFKSGDSLCYIDGNKDNNRLDNIVKVPAGAKTPYNTRIFLRNSYPNPKVKKRVASSGPKVGRPSASVVITNQALLRTLRKSLISVFSHSDVSVPASILYGCLVDNFGDEVKGVMSLNEFITELPASLCADDRHKGFLLRMDDTGMKPLPNDGFVSLRAAKEIRRVFGDVACRYRYVIDKKNPHVVSFTDMETPEGEMFDIYPAPDCFTAVRYIRKLAKKESENTPDIDNINGWIFGVLSDQCEEGGCDE